MLELLDEYTLDEYSLDDELSVSVLELLDELLLFVSTELLLQEMASVKPAARKPNFGFINYLFIIP